ncbi:exopolyphosphatase [Shewanella corallii]|uniref:Exopolyphosphatase n=1 Tax=Shewanella corallii TaxID=560080 RepID=A0ABT0N9D2_9GAMM|nr:exopolyphosphatase [Shewanella corallii]MCL2914710.1 exopolyphosphatase [Shewanella corallii]
MPENNSLTLNPRPKHYIAIDMGSNSFHLVIAREQDGQLQIVHKEKQQVKLAQGLDDNNRLSEDAMQRGLDCLKNFNLRFADISNAEIRLVATYTLRVAANRNEFLTQARAALPYPIEVISGHEEARLIYHGIAQSEVLEKNNLVIDIGGGSTEVIVGRRQKSRQLTSLSCGCVSFNEKFFKNTPISLEQFHSAGRAADEEFATLSKAYFSEDWDLVLGSSGTVKAVAEVLNELYNDSEITLANLKKLKRQLVEWGNLDGRFSSIDERRAGILPAGLAILISFFRRLSVKSLKYTYGALREGVLYEMAQIGQYQDVRLRTVDSIARLYHVDRSHAFRVRDAAMQLFEQVADTWQLRGYSRLLAYAATLHEVGIHINSRAHQRHGAYIISNADLPGFDEAMQQELASLIGNHRKRPDETLAEDLPLARLTSILRLAVLLNLGRQGKSVSVKINADTNQLHIALPRGKRKITLLMADLEREARWLQPLGIELIVTAVIERKS